MNFRKLEPLLRKSAQTIWARKPIYDFFAPYLERKGQISCRYDYINSIRYFRLPTNKRTTAYSIPQIEHNMVHNADKKSIAYRRLLLFPLAVDGHFRANVARD